MAGKGFSLPRQFKGSGDLRTLSATNFRGLVNFINNYVPTYDENGDLPVAKDLIVGGDIWLGAGAMVDGVDVSAHKHTGLDGSFQVEAVWGS